MSKYFIDEDLSKKSNITFTATSPKLSVDFTILEKQTQQKDFGLGYIDMVVLYGIWNGYI